MAEAHLSAGGLFASGSWEHFFVSVTLSFIPPSVFLFLYWLRSVFLSWVLFPLLCLSFSFFPILHPLLITAQILPSLVSPFAFLCSPSFPSSLYMCCAMLQALRVEAKAAVDSSWQASSVNSSSVFLSLPVFLHLHFWPSKYDIGMYSKGDHLSPNAHVYAKAYLKQQKYHIQPSCTTYWVHHYMQLFPFQKNGTVMGNTQIRMITQL